VIVDLVREASLPVKPMYQQRGTLVLAGTLIGLVVGILVVDGKLRFGPDGDQED
jgi:LPS O-antigen subunit length determinant protein (WzzB/FepE family)